jgi:hypothetical protein
MIVNCRCKCLHKCEESHHWFFLTHCVQQSRARLSFGIRATSFNQTIQGYMGKASVVSVSENESAAEEFNSFWRW